MLTMNVYNDSMQQRVSTGHSLPELVSKPPRYSDVMNCCVKAVFPTPSSPKTRTIKPGVGSLAAQPTLSIEELDSRGE